MVKNRVLNKLESGDNWGKTLFGRNEGVFEVKKRT
jgi:hypothetical protein